MISSPAKRDQSTKLKSSSISSRAHNLTFYKKDITEFKPDEPGLLLPEERKSIQGTILTNEILRQRTIEELEKKVDIVLRHNSHLLAENASIGELLAQKNAEIESLIGKLEAHMHGEETNLAWIEVEKKRLLDDFARMQAEHNDEVKKLIDQISKLHDQCFEVENAKNMEIQKLKEAFEKETYAQIQNLKRSQNGSIEILEAQVRALKDNLQQKNYQFESERHQNKLNSDKQADQIKHLQAEIKHLNKIRALELSECKAHYENEIHTKMRELERKKELDMGNIEATLRKLKKQLADKSIDVERLSNKLGAATQENQDQLRILKSQKEQLRAEIEKLEQVHRDTVRNERDKLKKLTELEIQNLQNANTNYTNSLKSEIQKLYELSECKTNQIKTLFDQLQGLRDTNRKQTQYLTQVNQELRKQLERLQRSYLEEIEMLKIKMAQLHQADVSTLKAYYENQLRVQAEQISVQDKQLTDARTKLHKQLQEKNELRKEFEIQLSKQKAKNADLKVKLAALSVEMKEQLTSMTSKMELTSQTLLREADLKHKGQAFHDEEKRKLHHLINAKDKQIADLNEQAERSKKEKEADLSLLKDEIERLKEYSKELDNTLQKQRGFSEGESKKKQVKAREQIDTLRQELDQLKNVDHAELKALIDKLQKQNIKLQKDLQHAQRQHKNAMVQLGIRNGFVETMQLESCAAIEEERTKVKVLMNKNQVSMKNYFEDKLASKQKQIKALKEQLIEKEVDVRDLITKYNELEKKLTSLLESQEKLRDFQNKVMNLGMDNNLVKNMAELFRTQA